MYMDFRGHNPAKQAPIHAASAQKPSKQALPPAAVPVLGQKPSVAEAEREQVRCPRREVAQDAAEGPEQALEAHSQQDQKDAEAVAE